MLTLNAKQKNLANGLSLQLRRSRRNLFDLLERMENFEGPHADIAYRLLQLAHDAIGNIEDHDFKEVAKSNVE